jgi:hypothetical protein
MRIISDFKDYYDSVRVYGFDPALIYKRSIESFSVSDLDLQLDSKIAQYVKNIPKNYNFKPVLLCFCGKAYVYWRYARGFGEDKNLNLEYGTFMTAPKVDEFILNRFGKGEYKKYCGIDNDYQYDYFNKDAVDEFADKHECIEIGDKLFHTMQTPVFLLAPFRPEFNVLHWAVLKNPMLKDLDFQKKFDAFLAYQEISMYFGGVLARKDEIPIRVGGDEVIAQQKGFDDKSFKKPAGLKDEKRKANRKRKSGSAS